MLQIFLFGLSCAYQIHTLAAILTRPLTNGPEKDVVIYVLPGCPSSTVNVRICIFRTIKLNNPIYSREICRELNEMETLALKRPLGMSYMYLSLVGVWHGDLISIGVRIIKRRKPPVYLDRNTQNLVTSQMLFTLTSAKKRRGKKARIGKLNTQTQTSQLSRIWRETHPFGFTLTFSRSYL